MLRFGALQQRGLIYWDEAKYALEGIRVLGMAQALVGLHAPPLSGKGIGSARPTHDLLIALSYAALGVHDYAPLLMNATAGMIAVLLTYLIAARLFGSRIGLVAALCLAVSQYDVIYARSALPESDGDMFLLLGVLLLVPSPPSPLPLRGERGRSAQVAEGSALPIISPRPAAPRGYPEGSGMRGLLAALLMGIAFTANFRLVVYIGAFVLLDLASRWRNGGRQEVMRSVPVWAAGLAAAPLLWEVAAQISAAHGVPLFRGDVSGETSYLRQAIGELHQGKAGFHFSLAPYGEWWWVREGAPMTALMVAGLVLAWDRRTFPWLFAAVPVVIAVALFSVGPFPFPRNMEAALPFACILAAAALDVGLKLVPAPPARRVLMPAALLTVTLVGASMSWNVSAVRSGFARAADYVRARETVPVLSTTEVMAFYLRGAGAGCEMLGMPRTLPQLAAYIRAGYRYAVLETHHNSAVSRYIRRHAMPVARFLSEGGPALGESLIASENANSPRAVTRPEYVDVYPLMGLSLRDPAILSTHGCSLDQVPP